MKNVLRLNFTQITQIIHKLLGWLNYTNYAVGIGGLTLILSLKKERGFDGLLHETMILLDLLRKMDSRGFM